MLRSIVNSPGIGGVSLEEKKGKTVGIICEKEGFMPGMKE